MNLQAIAETTLELYSHVRNAYAAKYGPNGDLAEIMPLFERAHHHMLTLLINESKQPKTGSGRQLHQAAQRQGPRQNSPKPKSDAVCNSCGRELTVGEKKYCDDNDSEYICYQCSH